ncbi:hypothetical protein EAO71_21205 [Streptomyces sp. ms191]|nr:hypothetical protein EAO71_21205 [Streptomyces sp. ms191]
MLGAVLMTSVMAGPCGSARADGPARVGREADLAHHGYASLWQGRLEVRLVSRNHGSSDVSEATVRLAFSEPPAAGQELPPACLWVGERVVACRTGALRAAGAAAGELAIGLRTAGSPDEVTVEIGTAWSDGSTDPNPDNDRHRVLVLATGDAYAF